jgi:hypothetical protein
VRFSRGYLYSRARPHTPSADATTFVASANSGSPARYRANGCADRGSIRYGDANADDGSDRCSNCNLDSNFDWNLRLSSHSFDDNQHCRFWFAHIHSA